MHIKVHMYVVSTRKVCIGQVDGLFSNKKKKIICQRPFKKARQKFPRCKLSLRPLPSKGFFLRWTGGCVICIFLSNSVLKGLSYEIDFENVDEN